MRCFALAALAALSLAGSSAALAQQARGPAQVHVNAVSDAELLGRWSGHWRDKASGAVDIVFSRSGDVLLAALRWHSPRQIFDYDRLTPIVRGGSIKIFTAEGTFDFAPPSGDRMNGTIKTFGGDTLSLELTRTSSLQAASAR